MSSAIHLKKVDALIIGVGPAGLTAALGMACFRPTVVIFDSGVYRNAPSHHMHGLPTGTIRIQVITDLLLEEN
jgi:thioredoxin reductase